MRIDERTKGSNPSENRGLDEIIEARLSRRTFLGGGLAAGAALFVAGSAPGVLGTGRVAGASAPATGHHWDDWRRRRRGLLRFSAVPTSADDALIVPDGYIAEVLIPWGTPLLSSGPAWKPDATNTAAEQAQQVGMHHDGMHYFPLRQRRWGGEQGLLVINHEYNDRTILYADGDETMTKEKVDKALAAHGVTIVKVARGHDSWTPVDSRLNRRITGATPMAFSGPVRADHPMLASELGLPVQGTLNNCAHGVTPWNTFLTCEENWNGYFGTDDPAWVPTELETRYGVEAEDFGYRWYLADDRFDLAKNRKELHRFGWVVEIDPFAPHSTPIKRTALGRIKHEGATFAESRGRAVIYSGDDEDHEYFYKFVSKHPWRAMRADGRSPLDDGVLSVAQLHDDASGSWLPLVWGEGALTPANGWVDQADVLLRTRQAADAVGATKLDRPEWSTVHPRTADVFLTLTNGTTGPNAPNPRNPNPYGHILKLSPASHDHTRGDFSWDIWVLAGDPAYDPQVQLDDSNIFGSPDGVWVDPDGRLWIQTDISNSSQNRPDRGYDNIKNNQMLAADPETGEIRRFLVGPRGCEITGVTATPDFETLFVNVQHPGETTTFWGTPTPENPRLVSNWPDFDPNGRPRAATIAIRKIGGGKIGT